jgi:hypothetical protein
LTAIETQLKKPLDLPAVSQYKRVLQEVLENRPSGTRLRLAEVLGKNRSFISQISNPAYNVPIPARHVERIFEVCHFSPAQRAQFLEAYALAHPGRMTVPRGGARFRDIQLQVPDLHHAERNRHMEDLLADVAVRIARLLEDH